MQDDKSKQSKDVFSSKLEVENKKFLFDLKENHKGHYLKITEVSGGRSSIIIPVDGLGEFQGHLLEVIDKASLS